MLFRQDHEDQQGFANSMSLLNPALLAGLGLAVIPVLLHLLLRAKPKRLIFPALRLIQQRRRQNVRRMQLRHLWLLLLRMLVIILIVLAVTRPSLPAANYSLTLREWLMLAAILAVAAGSYFGVMTWWKRQTLSRGDMLTRRTLLRGGVGLVSVLCLLGGVAWPYFHRVLAEVRDPGPRVAENVPVAAVLLFDTSASMSYKQANRTRLREAQDMAKIHMSHFPNGSKVAVAISGETTPAAFSTDLVAAQSRIEGLEVTSSPQRLEERLRALIQTQDDDRRRVASEQASVPESQRADRFVREIYVFTDLARSAWQDEPDMTLRDDLQRLAWLGIYLIDVGELAPQNVALTGLSLSREAAPAGTAVRVQAQISRTGNGKDEQTVELYLQSGDGAPVRKGTQTVSVESTAAAPVTFYPVDIPQQPFLQGELRLTGTDPLVADDRLAFTVRTVPPLRALVVAEEPAIARYWTLALRFLTEEGVSAFETESITTDQLARQDLQGYDVVCLINASRPSNSTWLRLKPFVESGGGLAVFLGASSAALTDQTGRERIDPVAYRSEIALSVLPARLEASLSFSPARNLDVRRSPHLLLKRFDELGALTELGLTSISRYWKVEPLADAAIVARYAGATEDAPAGPVALVERRLGQGRVLMMTTGVDGIAWNDLLRQDSGGIYFVLADQIMQYLASQTSATFNYLAGDEIAVPLDRGKSINRAILRMPDYKQRVIDLAADAGFVALRDLTSIGSYSLDAADKTVDFHRGFSVNHRPEESDFTRLEPADLDVRLGEDRYSLSRDPGGLERNVLTGRLGQELYGLIVALLAAVFALEQFTATWFYRTDET